MFLKGYSIVKQWRDKYFSGDGEVAQLLRRLQHAEHLRGSAPRQEPDTNTDTEKEKEHEQAVEIAEPSPEELASYAGPFFVYTSNVSCLKCLLRSIHFQCLFLIHPAGRYSSPALRISAARTLRNSRVSLVCCVVLCGETLPGLTER